MSREERRKKWAEASRRWAKKHPHQIREKMRRWRQRNSEKIRGYNARERAKNKPDEGTQRYWERHPERIKTMRRYLKYGITEAEYDQMLLDQDGRCLICHDDECTKLVIDHCHSTGRVRGLVCHLCNVGLGGFRDTIYFLKRAIEYLGEPPVGTIDPQQELF